MDDQVNTRMSESVPDPLVGREIDGYRIEEIIGRGGMGVVYRATQQSLGRPVAIKVLPEEVLENRQFLDRFEREVDILARLSHPNIVTVFERGVVDGRPYIAMEFVRGTSLRDVMRKGPLPPSEALLVVRSVLSALEHAHDQGIVHRDIKPENVLVAPGGIVKVADFGLSRHLEGDGSTRLTKTYVALGTFEYMSPEQREMSRDADGRSDLYATGVVLYEMIAGELPIGSFEPLSRKRPQVCDERIDDVVERSLKKSPDSRWQDARAMGDAVSRLLSNVPSEPTPVPVAAPLPATEEHGPKWKRVLSNIFGHEYPVARIEGKLPRKFAEKVLEDVAVQRYLGKLVTLWPHFPGGIEFSKESSRLKIELGGLRGDDPVRDKRVAAAVGAVLEANAHGKLRRIAVADHAWEDANAAALANPPIVAMFEPIRPSAIPVQSQVVSGVERRHPGMGAPMKTLVWSLVGLAIVFVAVLLAPGGSGHGFGVPIAPIFVICGLVAGVSFIWFVVRGSRPRDGSEPRFNYWLSFAVTALWVGIVAANAGELRDEEIAWLCVGAIASVFLLPRIPALLQQAGRAVGAILIVIVVAVFGLSVVYLSLGVDERAAEAEAMAVPRRAPLMLHILNLRKPLSERFGIELLEDGVVRRWVDMLVPGVEDAFTGAYSATVDESRLRVGMAGWSTLDAEQRGRLAAALSAAAVARLPKGSAERAAFGGAEFEHLLSKHTDARSKVEVSTTRLPPVSARPMRFARVTGTLPAGVLKELQDGLTLRVWMQATFDFTEDLFRVPPRVHEQGGDLYVTVAPQWERDRQIHQWKRAEASDDWKARVATELEAVAAAYGIVAGKLAPDAVESAALVPAEWKAAIADHPLRLPLWVPAPEQSTWRIALGEPGLAVGFGDRVLSSSVSRIWLRKVLPDGVDASGRGIRIVVTVKDVQLHIYFDSDWKTRRLRAYAEDKSLTREQAYRRLELEMHTLCVAYGHIAEGMDSGVTRTGLGLDEFEKKLAQTPFKAK
ncbi:MAG: serine/threonine-protein kinase [Planctomycetota bacterium]